jgi:hypothetical protein
VNASEPRRSQNALIWAIGFGYPDAAQLLIENGADVSARTTKLQEDYSPMEIEGYTKNVSGTAQGGYTPLMFAARTGDVATAGLLLEKGADPNAESMADGGPLEIASAAGYEDLALMLLEAGADPNRADSNGMTALHYAMRDGLKVLHGYTIIDGTVVCNFGGDPTRCKPLAVLSDKELEFATRPEHAPASGGPAGSRRRPERGNGLPAALPATREDVHVQPDRRNAVFPGCRGPGCRRDGHHVAARRRRAARGNVD